MIKKKISFSWDVIYKCNYRCPYCWWHDKWSFLSMENRFFSVKQLIQAWARIYNMYGQSHIDILGGEPFLYPNFVEFISEVSTMHTVNINTNLSCVIDGFVEKCNPSRVKVIPTFHPVFARMDDFLDKAKMLREAGFIQGVTYLAYPAQLKQLNFYREIFNKENLDFAVLSFWGKYNGIDYPSGYTEEERHIIDADLGQRHGECFQLSPIQSPRGKLCYAGCLYACIHPDGRTLRCGGGDYEIIGNFFDDNFKLLDEPQPCRSDTCPCNEWAFLLEEYVKKEEREENEGAKEDILCQSKSLVENSKEVTVAESREIYISSQEHPKEDKELSIRAVDSAISPIQFSWEICNTCNYRCPYCGRWNEYSDEDLRFNKDEWQKIWRRIYDKYGQCNMYISGAEPTTYPDFFDIVQCICDMHTITVCTNFSWDVNEIFDRNLDHLKVQFTPTFHSLFADFETFLQKLIILKDWIRDKLVFFVAYPPQMEKVEYYKEMINKNGLNFCIVPLRGTKEDGNVGVISTIEEKEKVYSITDMSEDEFAYLSQGNLPRGKACRAGYRYAIIRPTGKVFACNQSNKFLGYIQDEDFELQKEPMICPSDFCPYESYNLLERFQIRNS